MSDLQTAIDIASKSAAYARRDSRDFAIALMVQHLHDEHNYGPYTIARQLKLKMKHVKGLLEIERGQKL